MGNSKGFAQVLLLLYGGVVLLAGLAGFLGYKEYQLKQRTLGIETSAPNIPSPSPTPTATATPTIKPNTNPVIDCSISKECGGGTRKMTKNACDNSTCCLFDTRCGGPKVVTKTECSNSYCCFLRDGTAKLLSSKSACDNYYSDNTTTSTTPNTTYTYTPPTYYTCTLYYPSINHYETISYTYRSKAECDAEQASINANPLYAKPTATSIPTVAPTPDNSAICNQIRQEWESVKSQLASKNYSSSAEEAIDYINWKNTYNSKLSSNGCPGSVN